MKSLVESLSDASAGKAANRLMSKMKEVAVEVVSESEARMMKRYEELQEQSHKCMVSRR